MKIPCQCCGKPTVRKRLQIVPGLWLRNKPARACQACVDKPEAEHEVEYAEEYGPKFAAFASLRLEDMERVRDRLLSDWDAKWGVKHESGVSK